MMNTSSRKCHHCKRIIFKIVPDKDVLGIVFSKSKTIRDFRYHKENRDGSGHYYCMECLKKLFPSEY